MQFALLGFRVAESWNGSMWMISWVTVGEWKAGSEPGRGWNPLYIAEVFGSLERSLSRLLWTHKNVPETEFGFLLDLTAALIALELLQSKPPSKPTAVEWKCYAPNMPSFFMLWAGLFRMNEVPKLHLTMVDTYQWISAQPFPCVMLISGLNCNFF